MNQAQGIRLVLFGPPGAGKGTQAQLLKERLGIEHVSSGDLFRHHLSNGTQLGELARGYMNRGELVPDEVTIGMVIDRIGQISDADGFMLDGFPRNTVQAEALETALQQQCQHIDRVVHIQVADEELIRRLSNRYVCRVCQRPYARDAVTGAPPEQCVECPNGGEIYQRDDDTEEAVAIRLSVYHQETAPVLEFYRQRGLLAEIPGERPIEAVNGAVLRTLGVGPGMGMAVSKS
jgi:adenylate kinase